MVGVPIVVHYLADLQSVHGFRCYGNIAPNAKCHRVQTLKLTVLQITTFMVFAIIGAVFAAIQLIVAADGAGNIDTLATDCTGSGCDDVSRFSCVLHDVYTVRSSRRSVGATASHRSIAAIASSKHAIDNQPKLYITANNSREHCNRENTCKHAC